MQVKAIDTIDNVRAKIIEKLLQAGAPIRPDTPIRLIDRKLELRSGKT